MLAFFKRSNITSRVCKQVQMISMWEHKRMVTNNFSKTRIKGSMLQVNHIRLSYGPRLVLDDVSFTVAPGEKAGLIGVNGAGKSSLLKIIAGPLDADGGTIMFPRTFGYLLHDVAHEDPVAGEGTVRDFIYSGTGLDAAINTYEGLASEVGQVTEEELPALLRRFEQVQNELERLGY